MKKRKGMTLVIVLMIAVFLSLLGSTALFLSDNEAIKTTRQTEKTKAYYAARSGADAMNDWMKDKTYRDIMTSIGKDTGWKSLNVEDPDLMYKISILDNTDDTSVLNIISEGKYHNTIQKVALTYQSLQITQNFLVDTAIFASDSINIKSNSNIISTDSTKYAIVTNGKIITAPDNSISGNVFLGYGSTPTQIQTAKTKIKNGTGTIQALEANRVYTLPTFPNPYPNILPVRADVVKLDTFRWWGTRIEADPTTITQSGRYSKIEHEGILTILANDGETVEIYVENFSSNELLKVSGKGNVIIYADKTNLEGEVLEDKGKLTIYSKEDMNLSNTSLFCTLYSNKNINITANTSTKTVSANIISAKDITLNNNVNVSALLFAPNGNVTIGGNNNGKLYSSIVAEKIVIGSYKEINLLPILTANVPLIIPGTESKYTLDYWYKDVD